MTLASTVLKKQLFKKKSNSNALGNDLAVKKVKVILGSSFEQTG